MSNKVRIDKFLWSVRFFKTRKLSKDACDKSKIKVNHKKVRASYIIKINDIIQIKGKLINFQFEVINLLNVRVSAKLVSNYIIDKTEESELIKLKISKDLPHNHRKKGKGRPTKKERRDMVKGFEDYFKF